MEQENEYIDAFREQSLFWFDFLYFRRLKRFGMVAHGEQGFKGIVLIGGFHALKKAITKLSLSSHGYGF